MLLEFKQKPYIKCGKKKFELQVGDYILSNTQCYQFIPNKDADNYRYATKSDGSHYLVSKKELDRVLSKYKFQYVRSNKMKFSTGEIIKTDKILVNYIFEGA